MKKTTISLTLVLATALFTMGAKWTEKPIESLASIAGEWRGNGTAAEGHGPHPSSGADSGHALRDVFKEDGSYDFGRRGGG